MRFNFRTSKSFEIGRLPPEQREVLQRLAKGEITVDQAEQELVGALRVFEYSTEERKEVPRSTERDDAPAPTTEDEIARQMIERIAREVDEETRR
jgi:hypothetical protein